MSGSLKLSADTLGTAGVVLLTVVFIEYGGYFMLRLVRGAQPATDFQRSFFRAGHAHAGVLVTLALVCLILADAAHLSGLQNTLARNGVPLAAILMPAGFFFSAMGRGVTAPNRFVILVYLGALSLAAGTLALGIGLLTARY